MNAPSTPRHPEPDQEVELTDRDIPKDLAEALDLSSASEEAVSSESVEMVPTATTNSFDDFTDLDALINRPSPVNPFGQNRGLTASEPPRLVRRPPQRPRKLSGAQQSRLVAYMDAKLLQIQRMFIKYLSLRNDDDENDADDEQTEKSPLAEIDASPPPQQEPDDVSKYTLDRLLEQITSAVLLLWVSLYGTEKIPPIYHSNLAGTEPEDELQIDLIDPSTVAGQPAYLIRIMGDLADYLEKYRLDSFQDFQLVLELLAKIDNFASILIDQTEKPIFSTTDKVRMDSIVQRTKMLMVAKFEEFQAAVDASETDERGKRSAHSGRDLLPTYQLLVGEIYEGITDRTSI
ncbi:hypothetical protein KL930_001783 [Ogataea haglerorum]|uniref:Uncharacterized protein n=1 Tax=Ogataea haglerorum TaxID=1937702 RepID=A0AAN6D8E9_9ASCO|nr:uncharacterized protein KL911_001724 [Ogataea haglerorum]KAG7698121.1 hypothetical protein KL915_001838 [Ogataea haglerorum]KAG7708342.1 hypothetical protein KL914_002068 [Ogataea haglerorum]KAG7710630.1 hypothetical protein KL950_001543 [Ogataea haglerorum]KAG7721251.1 hypothetical protein KL913_000987 [Ogataea haglerorum]KAG7722005.1 hypothetical protein KL949_000983 [Ogataea haglerorum]